MKGVRPCRLCGKPIFFVKTAEGKQMPLDEKPTLGVVVDERENRMSGTKWVYVSHFATCPRADEARRPKGEEL